MIGGGGTTTTYQGRNGIRKDTSCSPCTDQPMPHMFHKISSTARGCHDAVVIFILSYQSIKVTKNARNGFVSVQDM
jgi:hypothetical protein